MCLTKLLTSNNKMKTLQSNHMPPCTNDLVWLRGNTALSHLCKFSGSLYEEFPILDRLIHSSQPTGLLKYIKIINLEGERLEDYCMGSDIDQIMLTN